MLTMEKLMDELDLVEAECPEEVVERLLLQVNELLEGLNDGI